MHWRRKLTQAAAVLVVVAPLSIGTAAAAPDAALSGGHGLSAAVRYTEHVIPHIKANDSAGLGYGYGYAVAKDNICVLADTYLTVNAQRSRYFGPDAPSNIAFGSSRSSLASDLYFQRTNDSKVIEDGLRQPVPHGPRHEVREIVRGYVAGYNRYLRDTGVNGISDPACRGAAWVRPITELDFYRHYYALATAGGQGQVVDGIISARPPASGEQRGDTVVQNPAQRVRDALGNVDMGSNAIAVGGQGSVHRRGVLLGNPHYPWYGGRRFWQAQLTMPGRLDVTGGSLLGIPLIQIGHNQDVAWSHTVATPVTFGLYQLRLAPGSPTSYLVDGKPEPMTAHQVRVAARNADGTVSEVEQTLYSTRYGPVLNEGLGLPLAWNSETAYAIRDANEGNLRGLNTWFEFGTARSTKDVLDVLSRTLGAPWVNTIAADRNGKALYADVQVVPHITDELANACNTPLGQNIFPATGLAVLDGARTACAWGNDPDAVRPGILGPGRQPALVRSDYVTNSNDSAWLSNPHQPITGYPRIMGTIATERSARTRMGITAVEQRLTGTDGRPGRGFSRQSMQDLLFDDRSFLAELTAADTAAMCAAFPEGKAPTSTGSIEVGSACQALAGWDRTFGTHSRGALLFQRFALKLRASATKPWRVPFDPNDPVRTPNSLDTANPLVQKAFGDAVAELRAANIPPDAPLGENQYVVRADRRFAVPGAPEALGVLNMIVPVWDPARGNTDVRHGSSFIQTVAFTDGRCPDTATLLTYSQSANPTSPHHADQTALFSQDKWVRGRFCERDILTSPALRVVHLRER